MTAMNALEINEWLWKFGHFRNPVFEETLYNVGRQDLGALAFSDQEMRDAVRSLQMSDYNAELLSQKHHGRPIQYDGEIGPATLELLSLPRCEVPDFGEGSGREEGATGSGSWLSSGCDPEHQGIHSIRVGIDTQNAPDGVAVYLGEALAIARACNAEMGISVRYILNPGSQKVEISKVFGGLGGTTIGRNYFYQGGCKTIEGWLSSRWDPGRAIYWAGLEVHETGHGFGLQHTRGGIMNPSILKINPLTWKSDPSHQRMVAYFTGKPIGPVPEPPAPPTPIQGIDGLLLAPSALSGILYMAGQRFMPVASAGGYKMVPADTPSFPI